MILLIQVNHSFIKYTLCSIIFCPIPSILFIGDLIYAYLYGIYIVGKLLCQVAAKITWVQCELSNKLPVREGHLFTAKSFKTGHQRNAKRCTITWIFFSIILPCCQNNWMISLVFSSNKTTIERNTWKWFCFKWSLSG